MGTTGTLALQEELVANRQVHPWLEGAGEGLQI